tara:strand:- start:239 stop:523 length:285 start_codon:yes stop_codon:yes gene_type:complete
VLDHTVPAPQQWLALIVEPKALLHDEHLATVLAFLGLPAGDLNGLGRSIGLPLGGNLCITPGIGRSMVLLCASDTSLVDHGRAPDDARVKRGER